jgi:hypothetical protein
MNSKHSIILSIDRVQITYIHESKFFFFSTFIAPPRINTNYSSSWTTNSPSFPSTFDLNSVRYYELIRVTVNATGVYTFRSDSDIDTVGYLYSGAFFALYPQINLKAEDDESGGWGQFKLTAYLSASSTYYFVITTYQYNIVGPFTLIISGPASVSLTSIVTGRPRFFSLYQTISACIHWQAIL